MTKELKKSEGRAGLCRLEGINTIRAYRLSVRIRKKKVDGSRDTWDINVKLT